MRLTSTSRIFLSVTLLFLSLSLTAQDTLFLPDNTTVYGEIKGMSSGTLTIETSYSENDFNIEWLDIQGLSTSSRFLVTLTGNERVTGYLRSTSSGTIIIRTEEGDVASSFEEIVELQGLDNSFWSRVDATIDAGFSFTQANNLQQRNIRSNVGYRADRWNTTLKYDGLKSSQDSVADIQRRETGVTFQYYPERKWFVYGNLTWFSNTEQAIDQRFSAKIGVGRSIIQNNRARWGVLIGVQPLSEKFSNEVPDTSSSEAFLGTEWNLFDTGDLSFYGNIFAYPSMTQKDPVTDQRRFRTDITFDVKYDLPLDFYVRTGLTLNYDNQPAVEGATTDYVWTFGFGWEL
jgi:hypothetical protein